MWAESCGPSLASARETTPSGGARSIKREASDGRRSEKRLQRQKDPLWMRWDALARSGAWGWSRDRMGGRKFGMLRKDGWAQTVPGSRGQGQAVQAALSVAPPAGARGHREGRASERRCRARGSRALSRVLPRVRALGGRRGAAGRGRRAGRALVHLPRAPGTRLRPVTSGRARAGRRRAEPGGGRCARPPAHGREGRSGAREEAGEERPPGPRAAAGEGAAAPERSASGTADPIFLLSERKWKSGSGGFGAGLAERRGARAAGETALAAVLTAAAGSGPRTTQVLRASAGAGSLRGPGARRVGAQTGWPRSEGAGVTGGAGVMGSAQGSPARLHCRLLSGPRGRPWPPAPARKARLSRAGRGARAGSGPAAPLGRFAVRTGT